MILIIGGTGLVGGHLLVRMMKTSEPIRCTVRTEHMRKRMIELQLEPVFADVRDYDSLVRAMQGARIVIHLATTIREQRAGDFSSILYDGVKNVVQAARSVGLRRVIHVGALGEKDSRYDSRRQYLYWKNKGTDFVELSELDFTILETSILFGPGDQHLTAIALALKYLPFFPFPRHQNNTALIQPLAVEDLVNCLLKAVDNPGAIRKRFSLAGPEVFDYIGLVQLVAELLGKKPKIFMVPRWTMSAAMKAFGSFMVYQPITTAMLDLTSVNSIAESTSTYEFFGIEPSCIKQGAKYLDQVGFRQFLAWASSRPSHGIFARNAPHL